MLKTYITGFGTSVILTLAAFFAVLRPAFFGLSTGTTLVVIFALAFVQLIIQLVTFLHLGAERGPRWNTIALVLTVGTIFVIVAGSIWIMNHWNMRMTPDQIKQYLIDQSG